MRLSEAIIILCDIIFLAYWMITATKVKPTKEVRKSLWDFRWVIAVIFFIGWLLQHFGILSAIPIISIIFLPQSSFLEIISVICAILGTTIAIIARYQLGANWSKDIDIKKGHKLITKGMYGYMRHPIYTGCLLLILGMFLSIRTVGILILFLFVLFLLLYKLNVEETLLTKHFPKEYPSYKKRVKRLIPFVW